MMLDLRMEHRKHDDFNSLERQVADAFPVVEKDGEMVQENKPNGEIIWRYRKITRFLIDTAERKGDISVFNDLQDIASGSKESDLPLEALMAIQAELDFSAGSTYSPSDVLAPNTEFKQGDGSKRAHWTQPLMGDDENNLDIRD